MPRVYTRTKAKRGKERRCGVCNKIILPGEQYLTWSFRYGGDRFRCMDHPPKRSDLTQSKMAEVYSAIESAEADIDAAEGFDDVAQAIESVDEVVHGVAYEYEEAAEQFGGEGENQERADSLNDWSMELEGFSPDDHDELDEAKEEAKEILGACPL